MHSSSFAPAAAALLEPKFGTAPEPTSLADVFARQPAETIAKGEAVFWEEDAAADVFQVLEGCLRLYRILPDGRRAVIGFVFGGEMLGLSVPRTYLCTAEAVMRSKIRRLGRNRFDHQVEASPGLARSFRDQMLMEMRAAREQIVVLGRLGAEERVIHFLLSAARKTGADRNRPVVVTLPMSRLDIADYLGLTIETVCRVISKLKRDGFIGLEGRHTIILARFAALKSLLAGLDDEPWSGPARERSSWQH
jgi:CRP/FNR family transcriptional regulator